MARQKPSRSRHVLYTTQSRLQKKQGPASSSVGNGSPEQSASSSPVAATRRPENNSPVEGAGTVDSAGTVEQSRTPQPAWTVTQPLIPSRPATSTPTRSDQILAPLDLTPVNREEATASNSSINSPAALTCMEQIKQFFATQGEFKQLEQRLEELKNQTSGKRSKQVQRPTKELSVSEQYCPFVESFLA